MLVIIALIAAGTVLLLTDWKNTYTGAVLMGRCISELAPPICHPPPRSGAVPT